MPNPSGGYTRPQGCRSGSAISGDLNAIAAWEVRNTGKQNVPVPTNIKAAFQRLLADRDKKCLSPGQDARFNRLFAVYIIISGAAQEGLNQAVNPNVPVVGGIVDFLKLLASGTTWLRVAMVLGGAIMVFYGVRLLLMQGSSTSIGKVVKQVV